MTPAATLLRPALALALALLLTPGAAHAGPPEGCTGFPDIPEAYICVTQWSPENAVPTVAPGPDQTVVIPEFCVFGDCTGPTPVTVPTFVVTQGNGVIAVITYNGQTHTVTVPPIPDPNALVQQVVQTVTDAVAAVLGIVEDVTSAPPPGTFTATAFVSCYGCGPSSGSLSGSFSGVINGRMYQNAPMSAWFSANAPGGTSCLLTSTASGNITIGSDSASFNWTHFAETVTMTFSGGFTGTGNGVFRVATGGVTCGGSAAIAITGTITTT